jgi:hypothetical protein
MTNVRAATGAGTGDALSLHRIDPASVREEVVAAGFVLDAESTILANKDDPHSIKVFDPSIEGETDLFAYRFVKAHERTAQGTFKAKSYSLWSECRNLTGPKWPRARFISKHCDIFWYPERSAH